MTQAAVAEDASAQARQLQATLRMGRASRRVKFFTDQTYHFQTLRALNDILFGGADTSDVLETIRHIREGDRDSWYAAWERTGDRVAELASRTKDNISRGRALLRAHNYYRTAEFLLAPADPRRNRGNQNTRE